MTAPIRLSMSMSLDGFITGPDDRPGQELGRDGGRLLDWLDDRMSPGPNGQDPRKPHTAKQVQMAWMLGKVFHHAPAPLRAVRDFVLDHTPFLQEVAGDSNPREINAQLALIGD